jgi:hypothetical protein
MKQAAVGSRLLAGRLHNFFCMRLVLWPQKYFLDHPVLIYYKGGAVQAHVFAAV